MGVVKVPEWEQYPWLRHGFSTRADGFSTAYGPGERNLGFTKDDTREVVEKNREWLVETAGAGPLATLRQVHSADVTRVDGPGPAGDGDGLVTRSPGITLGIQTADCVPVLVADVRQRVVGGFHAGWRGTVAGIVGAGIETLRREYGSHLDDLVAAIGPCIGVCCYEVGDELRDAFAARFAYAPILFTGRNLNLAEANRRQLLDAGISRISMLAECTACTRLDGQRKYFSHRAENGFTGRMMSVIGVV